MNKKEEKNPNRKCLKKPITIAAYLKANEIRRNTPGRVTPDGKHYRFVKGEWVDEKEWLAANQPIIVANFHANLENSDKSNLWMHY